ncbi:PREDICTED: protein HESO1-like isoform X3 [Nelumbo nucifera]|uniref:Protein HESO1-like isoform X3 n=1 Tax=Nelumbo nucifera TaxID=4432 RepID=A0A1U8Q538_NELNU|nr:PREDICTED: protein HESO1-like isoform X3 [Nelumbo nucifera]
MALDEKVLCKRAKKLELQESEKFRFTLARLSAIESFLNEVYAMLRPKPSDYHNRRDLIRIFNRMAKDTYDHLQRDKKIQHLRKFAKVLYTLQRKGHICDVQPILRARVPIIKFKDLGTGIECDISIENKDGIAKSMFIHTISAIDERFQKLSFLMKAWAKRHGINSSRDHTLNSLSIILFVAFHLQTRDPPILPPFSELLKNGAEPQDIRMTVHDFLHYGKKNKESLAELFVTLLAMMASVETLWPKGLCVSTYQGSWISKSWDDQVGYISVEDFTDRTQNVARAVDMEGLKKIYRCIHVSLCDLEDFKDGLIQAPKLNNSLFGSEPIPSVHCSSTVNHKRSFPFHDPAGMSPPLNPIPPKKRRFIEVPTVHQMHAEIPSHLPLVHSPIPQQNLYVRPGFGYGFNQMPSGSERPYCPPHLPFAPRLYSSGLQQNTVGVKVLHDPNLMSLVPHDRLGVPYPQVNHNWHYKLD